MSRILAPGLQISTLIPKRPAAHTLRQGTTNRTGIDPILLCVHKYTRMHVNSDTSAYQVLTEATVVRVLFADRHNPNDNLTATGVEFQQGSDASRVYVVHGKKEIILSAGTIKSPQILELSGIGRKDVLDRLGVDVTIDLPGVGENVQEHIMFCNQPFSPLGSSIY
jgi:choline dehydrogenase-like flavoprotein